MPCGILKSSSIWPTVKLDTPQARILPVARSRQLDPDSNLHTTTYPSPPRRSAQAAQKGQFVLREVGPSTIKIAANRCITITPKAPGPCATAPTDALGRVAATVVRLPRCADALCVSFAAIRARMASRQAAPPSSHVWFRSAGIESAAHWTRYGPGSRRRRKAEDQPAVGSHGTNQ